MPGGSGKTRLAIAVAQQLGDAFPDGIFFVPLAAVSTTDVMWTSIAEVLDAPPRARTPPGLFTHVANRSALLVLDNLEQVAGAGDVATQLLGAAPRLKVLATSRRALSVLGERRYPVPPLALPERSSLADAEGFGAVQLFVQQARSVRPDFQLTVGNVAEVVAICRRLDGLPLAVELAAARTRLLSPAALLRRLDQALDIVSTNTLGPVRQKTLRDTIAWSYDLLRPGQQAFFRRLAVFAGGADMDALTAVAVAETTDSGQRADPLDMVADLADASLVTIREGPDGEPRVSLLQTIHAYARDQLDAAGEAEAVRSAHAGHYMQVAERLDSLRLFQHLEARGLAEIELDNFRVALGWTLQADDGEFAGARDLRTGLRLASALGWLWYIGGYLGEGRRWFEDAIERAGTSTSDDLVACLSRLANLLVAQGETERARDLASRAVTMARTLDAKDGLAYALGVLGTAQQQLADFDAARGTLEEALGLQRRPGQPGTAARSVGKSRRGRGDARPLRPRRGADARSAEHPSGRRKQARG